MISFFKKIIITEIIKTDIEYIYFFQRKSLNLKRSVQYLSVTLYEFETLYITELLRPRLE